jgi:hypothetical protein
MAITTDHERRMDVLSWRLILAYLDEKPSHEAQPYFDAVFAESGLSWEAFELVNFTAANVAQIHHSPAARTRARKVALERLTDLVLGENVAHTTF